MSTTKKPARPPARSSKKQRRQAEARRRRRNNLLIGLGVGVVVVIVAALALSSPPEEEGTGPASVGEVSIDRSPGAPLAEGEAVPEFTAPMLGGGTMRWSDYVGSPTVLAVWAPWCPHCQAELPRLGPAVAARPELQMVSVATAIGQNPGPTPEGFLADEGLSFPVGIDDAQGTIMAGLGVQSFPTTYYVASDGTVVAMTQGEVPEDQLNQILDDLVAGG